MTQPQTLVRTIGYVESDAEDDPVFVGIDHVYGTGTCDHGHPDAGLVGLVISRPEENTGPPPAVLLTAENALALANRLERAASLILEHDEGPPDPEHELRRWQAREKES